MNRPDIETELPLLQSLDALRNEAKSLRDKGIEGFLKYFESASDPRWSEAESRVTRVLCRRVKHLAALLGKLPPNPSWTPGSTESKYEDLDWPRWPGTLGYWYSPKPLPTKERAALTARDAEYEDLAPTEKIEDGSPVLFAANLLRARLDEMPADLPCPEHREPAAETGEGRCPALDRSMLRCVYRLIRELFFVESPDWALGGAQLGSTSGIVSVFVTSECARALKYLQKTLEATAGLVRQMSEVEEYVSVISDLETQPKKVPLPPRWVTTELGRVVRSLEVTLGSQESRVLIDVQVERLELLEGRSLGDKEGVEDEDAGREACERARREAIAVLDHVRQSATDFCEGTLRALEDVLEELRRFRRMEELFGADIQELMESFQGDTEHKGFLGRLRKIRNASHRDQNQAGARREEAEELIELFESEIADGSTGADLLARRKKQIACLRRFLSSSGTETVSNKDLSATAHGLAYGTLDRLRRFLEAALSPKPDEEEDSEASGPGHEDGDARASKLRKRALKAIADELRRSAAEIEKTLAPTLGFMDAKLHETLFRASETSADLQDVAFAAACSLALGGDPGAAVYRASVEVLSKHIDEQGRLPTGKAFDEGSGGRQREAINAHALRSFAQVLSRVELPLEDLVGVAERMLRYFDSASHAVEEGIAWHRGHAETTARASTWVTALSIIALHRIVRLLTTKINDRVAVYIARREAAQLSEAGTPSIDELMCPDVGLTSVGWTERTIVMDLERMRAHLTGMPPRKGERSISSVILYGPPGTGKTTLLQALSVTSSADLYVVTPGDFLIHGDQGLEKQAKAVMQALCMLDSAIILFDEFDSVLYTRDAGDDKPGTLFDFLTGAMLPKLADLNGAAKKNRLVYALATNYMDRLDPAATRMGRFDCKRSVQYPDAASRACRIVYQLWKYAHATDLGGAWTEGLDKRVAKMVARTGQTPMSQLCKPGLYVAPKKGAPLDDYPLWSFLIQGTDLEEADRRQQHAWPMPAGQRPQQDPMAQDPTDAGTLDSGRRPKAPNVNELTIRQFLEARIVRTWDGQLWEACVQSRNLDWRKLRELAGDDNGFCDLLSETLSRLEERVMSLPEPPSAPGPRLGEVFLERNELTREQIEAILAVQKASKDRHRPFGQIGRELGFLTEEQVATAVEHQAHPPGRS